MIIKCGLKIMSSSFFYEPPPWSSILTFKPIIGKTTPTIHVEIFFRNPQTSGKLCVIRKFCICQVSVILNSFRIR